MAQKMQMSNGRFFVSFTWSQPKILKKKVQIFFVPRALDSLKRAIAIAESN